jgi:hypothetical protein
MARPANIPQKISSIEKSISELQEYDKPDLTRRDELGREYSFEEASDLFDLLFEQLELLERMDLEGLTGKSLENILSSLNQTNNITDKITSFDPSRERRSDRAQNQLLNDFDESVFELRSAIAPALAQSEIRTESLEELHQELNGKLEQAENVQSEMESILESVREASATVGVSTHANVFADEAESHDIKSRIWMVAFVIAGGLTAMAAGWFTFFSPIPPNATLAQLVQFVAGKVIILSILSYGFIWCSRNYFAHRHNFIVNTQRKNALSTFETFANATDDDATKNTVLVEAAEAIFSINESGYNRGQESQNPGRVTEVIKTLQGGPGGN